MGNVIAQWGGAYPVRYTYDPHGRVSTMRTFRDRPADEPPPAHGGDVTEWVYETGTGLLLRKRYPGGTAVNHTYTPDGRPLRTTWARSVWKQHHYDAIGQLVTITYSDGTATHYTYDAAGNLTNATGSAGFVFDYIYGAASMLTGETIINGGVTNIVERLYDAFRRPASTALTADGAFAQGVAYAYDGAGLLSAIAATNAQGRAFRLEYTNSLGLAPGHRLTTPGGNVITRAVTRDPLRPHLVTGVTNLFNGSVVSAWTYRYDATGRVISRNTDTFGYNARSEITGALLHTNAYGYVFDSIGNRLAATANGAETTYTANALNQYTAVNTAAPQYDADGNMTAFGVWAYTYDAENRMTGVSSNGVPVASYGYDYNSRLVREETATMTRRFIWDGGNIAASIEIDKAEQSTNTTHYVWGLDLSGTLQGAGGVGGLLATVCDDGMFFPCYDANGNVTEYIDESGAIRAHYEYSPFGEIIAQSGGLADTFLHRFSTKPYDPLTGFSRYQRRIYLPWLGCWSSRDPIGENGGLNLYGFVENNPISDVDVFGLRPLSPNDVAILNRLEAIARQSDKPDPEYANALRAVISDMRARIEAVKGPEDPANLRIGTQALTIWADPNRSRFYMPTPDRATCSRYVADVITHAGFESRLIPRSDWWKPGRRYPSAEEWFNATTLGSFRVVWTIQKKAGGDGGTTITWEQPLTGQEGMREPIFGDIISFEYHVGIYLGSDLYVSATARRSARDKEQPNRVVVHSVPYNNDAPGRRIYFSPE